MTTSTFGALLEEEERQLREFGDVAERLLLRLSNDVQEDFQQQITDLARGRYRDFEAELQKSLAAFTRGAVSPEIVGGVSRLTGSQALGSIAGAGLDAALAGLFGGGRLSLDAAGLAATRAALPFVSQRLATALSGAQQSAAQIRTLEAGNRNL